MSLHGWTLERRDRSDVPHLPAPESMTNFVAVVDIAFRETVEKKLSLLSGSLSSLVLSSPPVRDERTGVGSGERNSMDGFGSGTGTSAYTRGNTIL
jgi:hypothetical protein